MTSSHRLVVRARHRAEELAVRLLLGLARSLPFAAVHGATTVVAGVAFRLMGRRRRLAEDNLRRALGDHPGGRTVRRVARASLRSFLLTALPEVAALQHRLTGPDAHAWLCRRSPETAALFDGARQLHEASRGCVFVTPHLGNWELLPYVAAAVGIPMAIAARPLDNPRLEALLRRARAATGQLFLDRKLAATMLGVHLTRGRSVALLADQATVGGLSVEFFGRPASTTPLPAMLAVRHRRPLVVVGCLRTGPLRFAGFVGEPLWPDPRANDRDEVRRLTADVSRVMEAVIRDHPEQYLWMHDRWKTYDPPQRASTASA